MPKPPQSRDYWCFISYRHADNKAPGRQWATWLHQAIETYEVPADLVGTVNERGDPIPERIFPVFRDEDELPADADLASPIYSALDRSKFLVVLCSPRAAQSPYVSNEIAYFKKIGRGDHILAAILDGEPNVTDHPDKSGMAPECFPQALRFEVDVNGNLTDHRTEPIAPDFRLADGSEGWTTPEAYRLALASRKDLNRRQVAGLVEEYKQRQHLMLLKILAGIMGVPVGTLTKRDQAYQLALAEKRQRALRRWLAAVSLLAVSAVSAGIYAYWKKTEAVRALNSTQGLVAYLVGDFGDKLDRVGRIDLLQDSVGKIRETLRSGPFDQSDENTRVAFAKIYYRLGETGVQTGKWRDAMESFANARKFSSPADGAISEDRLLLRVQAAAYLALVQAQLGELDASEESASAATVDLRQFLKQEGNEVSPVAVPACITGMNLLYQARQQATFARVLQNCFSGDRDPKALARYGEQLDECDRLVRGVCGLLRKTASQMEQSDDESTRKFAASILRQTIPLGAKVGFSYTIFEKFPAIGRNIGGESVDEVAKQLDELLSGAARLLSFEDKDGQYTDVESRTLLTVASVMLEAARMVLGWLDAHPGKDEALKEAFARFGAKTNQLTLAAAGPLGSPDTYVSKARDMINVVIKRERDDETAAWLDHEALLLYAQALYMKGDSATWRLLLYQNVLKNPSARLKRSFAHRHIITAFLLINSGEENKAGTEILEAISLLPSGEGEDLAAMEDRLLAMWTHDFLLIPLAKKYATSYFRFQNKTGDPKPAREKLDKLLRYTRSFPNSVYAPRLFMLFDDYEEAARRIRGEIATLTEGKTKYSEEDARTLFGNYGMLFDCLQLNNDREGAIAAQTDSIETFLNISGDKDIDEQFASYVAGVWLSIMNNAASSPELRAKTLESMNTMYPRLEKRIAGFPATLEQMNWIRNVGKLFLGADPSSKASASAQAAVEEMLKSPGEKAAYDRFWSLAALARQAISLKDADTASRLLEELTRTTDEWLMNKEKYVSAIDTAVLSLFADAVAIGGSHFDPTLGSMIELSRKIDDKCSAHPIAQDLHYQFVRLGMDTIFSSHDERPVLAEAVIRDLDARSKESPMSESTKRLVELPRAKAGQSAAQTAVAIRAERIRATLEGMMRPKLYDLAWALYQIAAAHPRTGSDANLCLQRVDLAKWFCTSQGIPKEKQRETILALFDKEKELFDTTIVQNGKIADTLLFVHGARSFWWQSNRNAPEAMQASLAARKLLLAKCSFDALDPASLFNSASSMLNLVKSYSSSQDRESFALLLAEYGWLTNAYLSAPGISDSRNSFTNRVTEFLSTARTLIAQRYVQAKDTEKNYLRLAAAACFRIADQLDSLEKIPGLDAEEVLRIQEFNRMWKERGRQSLSTVLGEGWDPDLAAETRLIATARALAAEAKPRQNSKLLLAEAMSVYAANRQPENAEVQWQRAIVLDITERPAPALPFAEKAVKLDPKNSNYWNSKAIVENNLFRYAAAAASYEQASALNPESAVQAKYMVFAAIAWKNASRFDDARKALEKGKSLDSTVEIPSELSELE